MAVLQGLRIRSITGMYFVKCVLLPRLCQKATGSAHDLLSLMIFAWLEDFIRVSLMSIGTSVSIPCHHARVSAADNFFSFFHRSQRIYFQGYKNAYLSHQDRKRFVHTTFCSTFVFWWLWVTFFHAPLRITRRDVFSIVCVSAGRPWGCLLSSDHCHCSNHNHSFPFCVDLWTSNNC